MDIILREHIDNLGRRGDVVKVARGYARNYLLPRKLALPVTENNRRQIERERKLAEVREAADKQTAEAFAASLGSAECVIARRVGEQDTLYGSVTAADIAESLAAQQIDVDKRKIQLGEPIRELGEFSIPVKVHREVTAQVALKVIKEVVDE
ncbi:MAG: 50S ribosomal protein L9 [Vicinamibacterales bacterium]|jgi:large subunit ribosomal protein L9|nr:50S ribosomal protein L9 [Acidobacteriota bacterium]MDP7211806.1 50S ribosomal protein L9 [Vicinamibacterales bacterium]HJO17515.1 50S ribosomal protein L9 [Vicinamibacterales bacterium]|tara:strand:- start:100410 stop:100865 length:456 start_codon:yes stop_codon:yes gene_type:complete